MKIMLHGATAGTNFGDFLFAYMFYEKMNHINPDGENLFFECKKVGISQFFKDEMNYTSKSSIKDIFDSDMLVYISGGFFGERDGTKKENLMRLLRYVLIGGVFKLRKKPIAIIGVGGGPLHNRILRKSMSKLIEYALLTTVRDSETAEYFKAYGVEKEIIVTSDTAQVITCDRLPKLNDNVQKSINIVFKDKKMIFYHINNLEKNNSIFSDDFIESLNLFLREHDEYGVIIGSDENINIMKYDAIFKQRINTDALYTYEYKDPWQLCSLLNLVDLIITPKLHVGIIGATLSKSVISFSIHYEKVKRYYKQIDEIGRCMPFEKATKEIIYAQIQRYYDENIILKPKIINAAKQNFRLLESFVIER